MRDRLVHLSHKLESRGYLPSIGAVQTGPVMKFAHCPYLEIAAQNPLLCRFDVALLETALECDVRLVSSITSGDTHCRLLVTDEIDALKHS